MKNIHRFFFFIFLLKSISGKTLINTLPGYEGNFPFELETGYVGVENGVKQMFYYFVQSQRDPATDPLLVWNSGGPGFSSLWGFFYVNGPLQFDLSYTFDNTLPKLLLRDHTWTKFMNILYVDGPAGTGFSYSVDSNDYNTSNYRYGNNLNEFVHKWLGEHESFQSHLVYLASDGFGGNFVPLALDYIQQDNAAGVTPKINLGGYLLIGPGTNFDQDFNARYPYANRVGLVADEIFAPALEYCNGSYLNPSNDKCSDAMTEIKELIENINTAMWIEPGCGGDSQLQATRRSLQETSDSSIIREYTDNNTAPMDWCRKYDHEICNAWVNYDRVSIPDALGVLAGTKPSPWAMYNKTLDQISYDKNDISNLVPYHKKLSNTDINGLIMSGDHDMDIPYLSIEQWIWSLNLTLVERWRVWSVDNETTGYTRKFKNGEFNLTYASVKGGGHFTPEYKPKECYQMVYNWTNGLSL